MKRRIHRNRNEYLRTVFHDAEIYHAAFAESKDGEVWKPITSWGTNNANFFKLEVMPYPLVGRFIQLCNMYRWVKINYISFYFAVSAYTYTGSSNMDLVIQEDTVAQKKKFTGAIRNNIPNIGPIRGADKFNLAWDLDNVINEASSALPFFESSLHVKRAIINSNKYVKFFFRIPKDDRRFVGTDHVKSVTAAQNLDSFLRNVFGTKYRRVPTCIYGASDDFLTFMKFNYIDLPPVQRTSARMRQYE